MSYILSDESGRCEWVPSSSDSDYSDEFDSLLNGGGLFVSSFSNRNAVDEGHHRHLALFSNDDFDYPLQSNDNVGATGTPTFSSPSSSGKQHPLLALLASTTTSATLTTDDGGIQQETTTIDAYDMIVEKARLKFSSFMENEQIQSSSFTTSCYDLYRQCLFADAHSCIRDEMNAWRTFCVYLPFAIILILIAFIFNGLSAYFVTKNKNKYPRHSILQSLAISDTLLSLLTLLKRSFDFLPHSFGSATKMPFLLANTIWQACWIVSACGLLLLSLDCVLATRFPFFYRNRKTRLGIKIFIASLWAFAVTLTALLAHFNLAYIADLQYVTCSLMMVIVIVVVVKCFYLFMLAERVRRQQRRYFYDDRFQIRQIQHNRNRSVATIAIVMSSTFVCWLPLLIFFLLPESVHADNLELSNQLLAFCLVCFHINAVVNPVIYSFRLKDVRLPMQRNFSSSSVLRPIGRLLKRGSVDLTLSTTYTFNSLGHRLSTPHIDAANYLRSVRHRHSDPNQRFSLGSTLESRYRNTLGNHQHHLHHLHRQVSRNMSFDSSAIFDDDEDTGRDIVINNNHINTILNNNGDANERQMNNTSIDSNLNTTCCSPLLSSSPKRHRNCNNTRPSIVTGISNSNGRSIIPMSRKYSSPANLFSPTSESPRFYVDGNVEYAPPSRTSSSSSSSSPVSARHRNNETAPSHSLFNGEALMMRSRNSQHDDYGLAATARNSVFAVLEEDREQAGNASDSEQAANGNVNAINNDNQIEGGVVNGDHTIVSGVVANIDGENDDDDDGDSIIPEDGQCLLDSSTSKYISETTPSALEHNHSYASDSNSDDNSLSENDYGKDPDTKTSVRR